MRGRGYIVWFMLVLIAICTDAASGGCTMVQPYKSASGPEISFDTRLINLGKFEADSVKECSFKFVNSGDSTLSIISVTTDCNCTTAKLANSIIEPGDSGIIIVRFVGQGRKPGPFKKIIRVRSNAANEPLGRLYISGNIIINDKTW